MAIGEIALTGEIRNPPDIERILHEGVRLGMKKAYIGRLRNPIKNLPKELELVSFNNINTVSASLFK
jgi:predicted ATP-dependent serine protease